MGRREAFYPEKGARTWAWTLGSSSSWHNSKREKERRVNTTSLQSHAVYLGPWQLPWTKEEEKREADVRIAPPHVYAHASAQWPPSLPVLMIDLNPPASPDFRKDRPQGVPLDRSQAPDRPVLVETNHGARAAGAAEGRRREQRVSE